MVGVRTLAVLGKTARQIHNGVMMLLARNMRHLPKLVTDGELFQLAHTSMTSEDQCCSVDVIIDEPFIGLAVAYPQYLFLLSVAKLLLLCLGVWFLFPNHVIIINKIIVVPSLLLL